MRKRFFKKEDAGLLRRHCEERKRRRNPAAMRKRFFKKEDAELLRRHCEERSDAASAMTRGLSPRERG
jgi:hypothetical protein